MNDKGKPLFRLGDLNQSTEYGESCNRVSSGFPPRFQGIRGHLGKGIGLRCIKKGSRQLPRPLIKGPASMRSNLSSKKCELVRVNGWKVRLGDKKSRCEGLIINCAPRVGGKFIRAHFAGCDPICKKDV